MSIETQLPNVSRLRTQTDEALALLRATATNVCTDPDIYIGTVGSYARGEATNDSDLDFFAICPEAKRLDAKKILADLAPQLTELAGKEPSTGGAFNTVEPREEMLRNIGGQEDSNQKITRRVLLLLEGGWLKRGCFFGFKI